MTETGVIAMYIRERAREREGIERESVYGSEREKEGGGSCKKCTSRHTNTSIKRLIGIYTLTDGEWWKCTLKTQTGCR